MAEKQKRLRGFVQEPFLFFFLFLSEENLDRNTIEVEVLTQPVLQKSFVRIPDILREVTEECK